MMDPSEIAVNCQHYLSMFQLDHHLQQQGVVQSSEMLASTDMKIASEHLQTIVSTMYTDTIDAGKVVQQGNSWSLFGPKDPYLTTIKSIPPLHPGEYVQDQTTTTLQPGPPVEWEDSIKAMKEEGVKILDARDITFRTLLPGFKPTGGILPTHNPGVYNEETGAFFDSQMDYSKEFIPVVNNLIRVAFGYVLVDVIVLRELLGFYNDDIYREDIEEDPVGVDIEAVSAMAIRVGIMALLAIATVVFS